MDKLKYCKHFMFWTAIVVAIALAVIGIFFGTVIEDTLTDEIIKWVVMGIGIIAIFEVFAYIIAPLFWHIKYDGKDDTKHLGMD